MNELLKIFLTAILSGIFAFFASVYNHKKEFEKCKKELINSECKIIYDEAIILLFELQQNRKLLFDENYLIKIEKMSYKFMLYAPKNVNEEFNKFYAFIQEKNKMVDDINPNSSIDEYSYSIDEHNEPCSAKKCLSPEEETRIKEQQYFKRLDILQDIESNINMLKHSLIESMKDSLGSNESHFFVKK